jgi:hypothetical protein
MRLGRIPRDRVSDAVLLEGTEAHQAMHRTLETLAGIVCRPLVFVPLLLGTVALGFALPSTETALARCEMRGGSVAECRLLVLGR